ncbi:3'-5' exonuclease [Clostridium brassicae]|uniref:Exonuclease domain-containing protein n=1 Tax=Clostridium brassicae TaxID=2999072 RepID=A0ABT4DBQ3_9CLOT|nr:3'-5' exonuclease [Clostridium brassicae]MCY6959739.1 exonuclease domain-containing protein [Clostridium brassicae]
MGFYIMQDLEMKFIPYNLLALDFEFITTRVVKNKAKKYLQEIIEVGAVYKEDDKILEFESVIRPRNYIQSKHKPLYAIYAGRFSEEKIEDGMELEEAINELKKIYIPEETIWISWGKAEYDILKTICKDYEISFPFLKDDYLDLSKEFAQFYKIKTSVSLDKALNMLDIPSLSRHEALPDARALMKIAERMFIEGYEIEEKY